MPKIEGAGSSDKGRRARNEDAHRVMPEIGFFVVADGMGGYEGGAVASLVTVETLADFYARNACDRDLTWPFVVDPELDLPRNQALCGMRLAHDAVRARKRGPLAQMGSTVAAIAFHGERAVIAHAGDSRAYRLRARTLTQLTRDHSFVEEIAARGDGISPADRARIAAQFGHVITRAIGIGGDIEPGLSLVDVRAGDVFLLCTDGVHGVLDDEELAETLALFAPRDAADILVQRAIEAGSSDNVTAVVARAT
ncbi:MAG: protein phosphatase 2C domain-containing protein [Myxococcota bacterium]|nr:protein phosphatase 2C domain-containing protein [Myxococcota bacterium]